jgi:DNA-binding MarR family transcriptional regulator
LLGRLEHLLERQDINQDEYRVLASFSGLEDADLPTLQRYTLLDEHTLVSALHGLEKRGFIQPVAQGHRLSHAGQERLVSLMAIAKSNEADMLGAFNAEEAQQFKEMLKRAICWTA